MCQMNNTLILRWSNFTQIGNVVPLLAHHYFTVNYQSQFFLLVCFKRFIFTDKQLANPGNRLSNRDFIVSEVRKYASKCCFIQSCCLTDNLIWLLKLFACCLIRYYSWKALLLKTHCVLNKVVLQAKQKTKQETFIYKER